MPRNIVWICTDQQRADSLGCAGNLYAETPRLDALAGSGTVLGRLVSAHPMCMPSRASMLSGQHPTRHGVIGNGIPLAARAPDDHPRHAQVDTLAHHCQAHGYHTRCIGKLHLQPHQASLRHGYRESYAMWAEGTNAEWSGPLYGFEHLELSEKHGAQPGGRYLHWLRQRDPAAAARLLDQDAWPARPCTLGDLRPAPIPAALSATAWVAERFSEFLDGRKAGAAPFFCWLGIPDPHHPWQPPAELAAHFATRPVMPWAGRDRHGQPAFLAEEKMELCDDAGLRLVRQYTNAQVALIDQAVGSIEDALRAHGLWEDTVLLFTSDHGDFLGDYGRIRKTGLACNSLNRVPGIIHDPSAALPASITGACGHVDLAPTLAHAAGIPWEVPDGRPLQTGGSGGAFVPCLLAEPFANLSWWTDHERFTWYPQHDACELYDHRADPQELVNRASDHPRRCAELRQEVLAQLAHASVGQGARMSGW